MVLDMTQDVHRSFTVFHCGGTQDCSSTSRNSSLVYPPRTQLHLTFLLATTFMSVPGEGAQRVWKASTRPGENYSSKILVKPHAYTQQILNT